MKVTIYGAGAIGGYLAVCLKRAKEHEISIVARGKQLHAIRESGLTLENKEGEKIENVRFDPQNVTDTPSSLGPQDIVIVCLKANQVLSALEGIRTLLKEDTVIVTAMNGIPWWYAYASPHPLPFTSLQCIDEGGRLWASLPPRLCVGAIVWPATSLVSPGMFLLFFLFSLCGYEI